MEKSERTDRRRPVRYPATVYLRPMMRKRTIISDDHESSVTTDTWLAGNFLSRECPFGHILRPLIAAGSPCTARRLSCVPGWSKVREAVGSLGGTHEDLDGGALPSARKRAWRSDKLGYGDESAPGDRSSERSGPIATSDRFGSRRNRPYGSPQYDACHLQQQSW